MNRTAEGAPKCLVKITCDVEENRMFGRAFMWPNRGNEDWRGE